MRRALGAGEGRVMVGWLAEAVVLTVPAAVAALALAFRVWSIRTLGFASDMAIASESEKPHLIRLSHPLVS